MRPLLLAIAIVPLACAATETPKVTVTAQRDAEWAAYRQAYKAAAGSAAHTATRPLIQVHMQLRPREPGASLQGLHLQLVSESMTVDVPVDGIGRAALPMLKKAFDEDAVLRLNRQKGLYRFSGRYSIRERDDGIYSMALLREACEQVLGAQRASGSRFRLMGKKCSGVRFIYPPGDSAAAVQYLAAGGNTAAIRAAETEPFESGSLGLHKVVFVRFDAWPADGTVLAERRPLAIGPMYE